MIDSVMTDCDWIKKEFVWPIEEIKGSKNKASVKFIFIFFVFKIKSNDIRFDDELKNEKLYFKILRN